MDSIFTGKEFENLSLQLFLFSDMIYFIVVQTVYSLTFFLFLLWCRTSSGSESEDALSSLSNVLQTVSTYIDEG